MSRSCWHSVAAKENWILIEILLFGNFQVLVHDEDVTARLRGDDQRFLAVLATLAGTNVPREELCDLLHPNKTVRDAQKALYNSKSRISKTLGVSDIIAPSGSWGSTYALNLNPVQPPTPVVVDLLKVRDLMGTSDERFASEEYSRLGRRGQLLANLRPRLEGTNSWADWIETQRSALELSTQTCGDRANALPHQGIAEKLSNQASRWSVSAQLQSMGELLEREGDLEEIEKLLCTERKRLLVLKGPGGIGKTHLALAAAARLSKNYLDGAVFVPLDQITSSDQFTGAITRAVINAGAGKTSHTRSLEEILVKRHILIVLDNFEHVLEASRELLELFATCPNVSFLVTTQADLPVPVVKSKPVNELKYPKRDFGGNSEKLLTYPSVRFLQQRIRDRDTEYEFPISVLRRLSSLCREFAGVPLFLDLLAAQATQAPIEQVVKSWRRSRQSLKQDAVNRPARQHGIDEVLDWSIRLLAPTERHLFYRLCCFRSDFTLTSAEIICVPGSGADIDELLRKLKVNSLIRFDPQTGRYSISNPIKRCGWDRLSETDQVKLKENHANYFRDLASTINDELVAIDRRSRAALDGVDEKSLFDESPLGLETLIQPQTQSLRAHLEVEEGELVLATEYLLESKQYQDALCIVTDIWGYWFFAGAGRDASRWLDNSIGKVNNDKPSLARERGLDAAAHMAWQSGDQKRAYKLQSLCLKSRRIREKPRSVAHSHGTIALSLIELGKPRSARRHLFTALESCKQYPDARWEAMLLNTVGISYGNEGNYSDARMYIHKALNIRRGIRDPWGVGVSRYSLGIIELYCQNYPEAVMLFEESIKYREPLRDRWGIAYCHHYAGLGFALSGDIGASKCRFLLAVETCEDMDDAKGVVLGLEGAAFVAESESCYEDAAILWSIASQWRNSSGVLRPTAEAELARERLASIENQFQQRLQKEMDPEYFWNGYETIEHGLLIAKRILHR